MKVTLKGFVHKNSYDNGLHVSSIDMSEYGHVLVGPVEFEYEVPENYNPVAAEVAGLQKQADKLADEYHRQRAAIQSRINDLLCLEAPKVDA
jgi:hypothetical protein